MELDGEKLEIMKMRRRQLWMSMNSVYGMNPSTTLTDEARDRYVEMYKEYMELGKKFEITLDLNHKYSY